MAGNEIKSTLRLEGEQQFRQAMNQAAAAVKALNAEEKAAAAQFKATGDAETYKAEQTRILTEKMEEQRKAVAAAEEAMKQLSEKGFSKNDRVMQQWRTKLANAQTALAGTQQKLNGLSGTLGQTSQAFDNSGQAAADYSAQLDAIGKSVSVQGVVDSVGKITDSVEHAASRVKNLGKKIIDLEKEAGNWADNALTEASKAGVDVETWQAWQYASEVIDTSASDIQAATDTMNGKLLKENKDVVKSLNGIGVAITSASGEARDGSAVFWDTIDALHAMDDVTERNNRAQQIFGSSYRNLIPLIEKGRHAWEGAVEQGKKYALPKDQVEILGEMDDAFTDLESSLNRTKLEVLSSLAPIFTDVASAMSTAVTAFNEFLQTEEGQQMMEDLGKSVGDLVKAFIGENGEGFQTLVEGAKGAVRGLTDALKWLADNKDLVVTALGVIGGAFLGIKVAEKTWQAIQFFQNAKNFNLFGNNGGATPTTPTPTTQTPAQPTTPTPAQPTPAQPTPAQPTPAQPTPATPATPTPAGPSIPVGPIPQGSMLANSSAYAYLNGVAEANAAFDAAEAAGLYGTGGGFAGLNSTGLAAGGAMLAGAFLSAAAFYGITQLAKSGNTVVDYQYDPHRYDKAEYADIVQSTVRGLMAGGSQNADWQLRWMAANVGGENIWDLFNFTDKQRGDANFLEDIFGGYDVQSQAAAYAFLSRVYGDENSRSRDERFWGNLSDEQKILMQNGLQSYQQVKDSGATMDYTWLLTSMQQFFSNTGTFNAQGLWTIPGLEDGAKEDGQQFGEGFKEGIEETYGPVQQSAAGLGDGATESLEKALDEHSPSRVTRVSGLNFGQGFAAGIRASVGAVTSAARALADAAVDAYNDELLVTGFYGVMNSGVAASADAGAYASGNASRAKGSAAASGGGSGSGLTANIYMDKQQVGRMVAGTINEVMGARVSASRREV